MPATRAEFLRALQEPFAARPVVWTGDLTYWQTARAAEEHLPRRWRGTEGLRSMALDLGMFPYFQYELFWPYETTYSEVSVEQETQGRRTRTMWRCQAGVLTGETERLPESHSTAQTRYPVQTADDLDVLCAILEDRSITSRLPRYLELAEQWGDSGYPSIGLPRSPMSSLVVEWAGAVNTAYLVADEPGKVESVLALLERDWLRAAQMVIEAGVPVVHFPDNLTGATYTSFFERFMRPFYRRALERLHAGGVRCAVHLDGTVRGLLPKLSAVGFDAVESLTQAPVGDAPVGRMRELAGRDDLVLWGGVPGAAFSRAFPERRFLQLVREALEAWRGTPFILGTADQVPPDGDIQRCRMVSDMLPEVRGL